jgi:hypothetical protein
LRVSPETLPGVLDLKLAKYEVDPVANDPARDEGNQNHNPARDVTLLEEPKTMDLPSHADCHEAQL